MFSTLLKKLKKTKPAILVYEDARIAITYTGREYYSPRRETVLLFRVINKTNNDLTVRMDAIRVEDRTEEQFCRVDVFGKTWAKMKAYVVGDVRLTELTANFAISASETYLHDMIRIKGVPLE